MTRGPGLAWPPISAAKTMWPPYLGCAMGATPLATGCPLGLAIGRKSMVDLVRWACAPMWFMFGRGQVCTTRPLKLLWDKRSWLPHTTFSGGCDSGEHALVLHKAANLMEEHSALGRLLRGEPPGRCRSLFLLVGRLYVGLSMHAYFAARPQMALQLPLAGCPLLGYVGPVTTSSSTIAAIGYRPLPQGLHNATAAGRTTASSLCVVPPQFQAPVAREKQRSRIAVRVTGEAPWGR